MSYAGRGGALFKGNGARLDLTASTFLNNHAVRTDPDDSDTDGAGRGGAIYATGSTGSPTQGAFVGGCTFEGNVADMGGAAVASWLESWFFNSSSFVDNCVEINQCVGCMRPCWLRRVVTNRHRHAIEQASRRWRGERCDDSARKRRKILISHRPAIPQPGDVKTGRLLEGSPGPGARVAGLRGG